MGVGAGPKSGQTAKQRMNACGQQRQTVSFWFCVRCQFKKGVGGGSDLIRRTQIK